MKKYNQMSIFLFLILSTTLNAQIGIGTNTPSSSSVLDIVASGKGILIPRMSTDERNTISNPEVGLIIYNTDELEFNFFKLNSGWKDMSTNYKTIESSSPITTALTTDNVVNSMSINAAEGTYLVSFNSQFNNEPSSISPTVVENNTNALATFSIYANGFKLSNSERILTSNANNATVNLQIVAQVTSGLPIEIKWHTDIAANVLSIKNRTLTLTKLK
jgi:hypothetical protein